VREANHFPASSAVVKNASLHFYNTVYKVLQIHGQAIHINLVTRPEFYDTEERAAHQLSRNMPKIVEEKSQLTSFLALIPSTRECFRF
jgi:hypothetical protein